MGNKTYQLTSAGPSAHGWQIGWHWLAGNFYFPCRRIFIFCFSESLGINIEGYEGLVHCPDFLFKSVLAYCVTHPDVRVKI